MQRFIDIHTHQSYDDPDILAVHNLHDVYQRAEHMVSCSLGVHPWYINNYQEHLDQISRLAHLPSVRAIGECGLDKICQTDLSVQTDIFMRQIDIANRLHKPIIIHCVRAFDEVITLLRNATVPVIFHGFQKNPVLAQRLIDLGFYLSFGAALTNGKKNAIDSLSLVPANRFFLETDDSPLHIRDIYHVTAKIRGITPDALMTQLQRNYQSVFNT